MLSASVLHFCLNTVRQRRQHVNDTHLNFPPALHLREVQDDNVSRRACYKQRLIRTVHYDALYAELRIVTQWVVAANLTHIINIHSPVNIQYSRV